VSAAGSPKQKVLHLRASNFVGGPERQILNYAEVERGASFDTVLGVFVGDREGNEYLQTIRQSGLEALILPAGRIGALRAAWKLARYARDNNVALLCTHGYKADLAGLLAGYLANVPVACFLHGWTGENTLVRIYERLDRALLRFADTRVFLSRMRARQTSFGPPNHVVINAIQWNCSDAERQRARAQVCERFGIAATSPVVVAVGRLSPEKGTAFLLQAWQRVQLEAPEARCVIFGDGRERRALEELADQLKLRETVRFAGFVPNARAWVAGTDVLVNPSLSEEMPVAILEAMAAAVPVVATAVGGVAEIAGDGGALELIEKGNPEAIAEAVLALVLDPQRALELGRRGQQRVRDAYSPLQQKQALEALYRLFINLPAGDEDWAAALAAQPPLVSIVIPVRNEQAHIAQVLEDLLAQEYPADRVEILVVDGNSEDGTRAVVDQVAARARAEMKCLANPGKWSSAGRNVGARASRGELVAFVDGHCRIPSRTWLRDTVEVFARTGADCLCRPQPLITAENTPRQRAIADARSSLIGHGADSTIYDLTREQFVNPSSSGAAYRRSVFAKIGYYDERFDACEDVEFNYRVHRSGLRSYLSPRLAVWYWPRSSFRGLFQQLVRYGRGRVRLARKHKGAGSWWQMIPLCFLRFVVGGLAAAAITPVAAWVYLALLLAYGGLVLAFAAAAGMKRGFRHFAEVALAYPVIHIALAVGLWRELLQPSWGRSTDVVSEESGGAGERRT